MGQSYIIKLVVFVTLFLLASAFSSAQALDSYTAEFDIAFGKVVVNQEMIFKTPVSGQIPVVLPADAQGISVKIDGKFVYGKDFKTTESIDVTSVKTVEISYVTKELLDNNDFLVSMKMPYDAERLDVKLTLPEGAVLMTAVSESSIGPSSVYPTPAEMTTDGKSILIKWSYEGLKKGDEKSFLVMFKEESFTPYILAIAVLLAIVVALLILVAGKKRSAKAPKKKIKKTRKAAKKIEEAEQAAQTAEKKEIQEEEAKEIPKEVSFEKHLKEDEEQVVNILKQRGGECEQGTLRVITGFSKAKLSGLLNELEDRNIVLKEKRGKKNRVFLRDL